MFGRNKRTRSGEEWRTRTIERRHQGHLLPIPDLDALADEIISRSGLPDIEPGTVKGAYARARVEGTILQQVEEIATQRLARHIGESAAAGMRILKERDDFHPDLLFDYLSMHGPAGIALHNKIVELLTGEQFVTDFAEVVQERPEVLDRPIF
ncbi:hypothetical protein [Amycolatopsis magusensis]|uniref:hypothetical protein n=1 Tax=Amycolatopsis magusensis TaxID=882444 RepID=UPI003C2DF890